ncbi:hypothetical protein Droror1_Dr00003981 [Drosera rotundifolia]
MYQALPYKSWNPSPPPPPTTTTAPPGHFTSTSSSLKQESPLIKEIVSENAVVVLGRRGCCMTHVVKRLLHGLGVNPAVHDVDEEDENGVVRELGEGKDEVKLPAVFIGGKFYGGLDRVMAAHITGELTPVLREAGALWL